MKRVISLIFIVFCLLFGVNTTIYGYPEPTNTVFVYEYKNEDTYGKIKDAVKIYCEKYDVENTENIIYGMEYNDSIPIVAEYNEKYICAAIDYAENLGIAFQIQDDILDLTGDETKLGKPAMAISWVYIAVVLLLAIGVPYFSVISTSLIRLRGYGLQAGNFTFQHYIDLFTSNAKGLNALKNSFFLAVSSASICAVLGTVVVLAIRKTKSKFGKALEAVSLLPEMIPSIVLIIGIMLFWNQIYNVLPLYNTLGIMVLAYVVLFLPYTIQYVTSAFTQISISLMAAGQVFGGSPVYIFRRITLPLIIKGVMTGWMMTFIIAFRELVTASLIAPPNTLVISTYIVREFEQGSVSVGMAMAVLCVLFTTTALLILNQCIDKQKG